MTPRTFSQIVSVRSAILLICLVVMLVVPVLADEEITNGGFETQGANPADAQGWTAVSWGLNRLVNAPSAHSGDALYFCEGCGESIRGESYQDVDFTDVDTLTFWYKSYNIEGSFQLVKIGSDTVWSEYSSKSSYTKAEIDVSSYTGVHRLTFISDHAECGSGIFSLDDVSAIAGGSSTSPPTAAFSVDNTTPYVGQEVTFTDSSTNTPTSWCWDIDNDGDCDYTTQNCEHTYSSAGLYTVNLTVTNTGGSDSEVKTDYITVTAAPTPTPTPTPSKINAEVGEKYIRWEWPAGYLLDVYVDGKKKLENTTMSFYYLKDLKPNEEHRLDLMNVSSEVPIKTSVVKTTAPSGLIWIMVIISLALSILVVFLEGWTTILVGAIIEVCGIFGRTVSYGYLGADWLFIGFMIFAGVYIVKAIYEIGKGEIAWY